MPSEVVNMEQDLQDAERTIHRAERLITDAIMKDLLENNGACIPQEINDARSILMLIGIASTDCRRRMSMHDFAPES